MIDSLMLFNMFHPKQEILKHDNNSQTQPRTVAPNNLLSEQSGVEQAQAAFLFSSFRVSGLKG